MRQFTAEQFEQLWRTTVDSKIFDIQMQLQELQKCFYALVEAGEMYPSDKISVLDRDIKLLRCNVSNCVSDVSSVRSFVDNIINRMREEEKAEQKKVELPPDRGNVD